MEGGISDTLFRSLCEHVAYNVVVFDENGILFTNQALNNSVPESLKDSLYDELWRRRNEENTVFCFSRDKHCFFIDKITRIKSNDREFFVAFLWERGQYDTYVLSRMVDESNVSVIIFDETLKISYVNEYATQLYGYKKSEMLGMSLSALSAEENSDMFFNNILKIVDAEGFWRGEDIRQKKNKDVFVSSSSIVIVRDEEGKFLCYYDASRDNFDRVTVKKRLDVSSKTDDLTGIPNRRALLLMLEQQWDFALAHAIPISIVIGDIDYFKAYNDAFGPEEGDTVLKRVAGAIRTVLRLSDFVARYGGDEFVLILVGATAENSIMLVRKIMTEIERLAIPHPVSPVKKRITMSFGISESSPEIGMQMLTAIRNADNALYEAKQSGRNTFRVFG